MTIRYSIDFFSFLFFSFFFFFFTLWSLRAIHENLKVLPNFLGGLDGEDQGLPQWRDLFAMIFTKPTALASLRDRE